MAVDEVLASAARAPNQRLALLVAYRYAGEGGLTDEEAAAALNWLDGRRCWWRRCSDLREQRLIERHLEPIQRKGRGGVDRIVCVISPSGEAMLLVHGL